ncbi:hypothetical protein BT69DRAFT_773986 [Atractiella rhizophila]|nr:hypothetical protein BT69DRAFT_773986 [Atractiella rhizophila]
MGDRQNKDIKEEEIEVDIPPLDMDNVAWTEWECICTIIPEWRAFADAFSTSNNPEELKLSHYIHDEVIPALMREYKEKEQKRMKEEAKIEAQNAARKRSTRLATREAEKEEAARAKALQDDDSRASRLEKRKAAEEAKLAAEEERKARLADREARFRAREEAARLRAEGLDPSEALKVLEGNPDLSPQKRKRTRYAETDAMTDDEEKSDGPKRKKKKAESSDEEYDPDEDSEASTEKDEPDSWYLNCEHCGKSGLDVDDGHKLVCCDQCEEWVHLKCLAKADREAGRPEKDYQEEDFLCGRCQRDPSRRKQEHTSGNWSDDEYDGGDGTTKRRRNRSPPKAANARSRAPVKHTQSSPAIPSGSSLTPKAKAPTGFSSLHTTPNRAPAQSPAYRSQTIAGMPPSPVQAGTPFRSGPLRPPGTPAQHSLWGGPDHNTDPYPYITVWHQLVNDPSLMHRLPPVFQNHFGQLLGKIAPPPIDIYCNIANMIRNDMTGTRVEHLPQQFQPFFRPYVVPLHVRQAATRQAMLGGSGAATTPEQQQKLVPNRRQTSALCWAV